MRFGPLPVADAEGAILAHAVRRGRGPEVMRLLVAHGAELDRPGGETWRGNVPQRTPYQHARLRARDDVAATLAELGASTGVDAADAAIESLARGEQPDDLRPAAAAHRVRKDRALVRVGTGGQEEADELEPLVVERVRERVRAAGGRTVREQELEARRVRRLRRVVQGLAVVGSGARLEQDARQLGLVDDAGGAVEGGHRAVLVLEARVRVGASVEEGPRERRGREARVADVEDGRPAARAARRARVAVPRAAEDERRPGVVRDLRVLGEHRLGPRAPALRGGEDERLRGGLHR